MSAVAEALGPEAEDCISSSCIDHTSFLRLNYYPIIDQGDRPVGGEPRLGIGRHTDSGKAGGRVTEGGVSLTVGGVSGPEQCFLGIHDPNGPPHSVHTSGALTIILQDTTAALEVFSGSKQDNGDGVWVPVDPVEGALTINTGDMLMVWSNGKFKVRFGVSSVTGSLQ